VVASKKTGLESYADKSKYMVMFRDQNARVSHKMKIDNSSVERMDQFESQETILTNRSCVREEIKSTLTSGSACYYSVQNLFCLSVRYPKI
jgi:gamma-glutamylcyclotransferase (GGCT)/AIG2-like uncharacterized protein YtfP